MKAVVRPRYGSSDVLQLTEIAEPDDGEVLIQVHAASVGAWDWHYLAADPHLMRLAGEGFLKPKVPVAGLDVAGRWKRSVRA
jgi:NADPH:quinone reductase-like Zn-dependent oxidoreductase